MTLPASQGGGRRTSRGPGFTYVTIMLVVLLIFAIFTFAPPPSSPPAIAEVAPKALEQITDAPIEQAVEAGGTRGNVPAKLKPSVGGKDKEVVSPFQCIGVKGTSRQIEDPQSPPCVPFWQGDNGGATYKGVTRDTITVVVPDLGGYNVMEAYEAFFNRRFQLYGRKLKLIGIVGDQQTSADEATAQQYLAAKADEEYHAFASLALEAYQGTVYYRELARRKILAISYYPQYTQQALEGLAPYVWQYGMSLDRIMSITGDWMCKRLVGRTADYTTDPTLIGQKRKLGLIYQDYSGNSFDPAPAAQALKSCGASFAVVRHFGGYETSGPSAVSDDPGVRSMVLDMKNSGVTSVLCLCNVGFQGPVAQQATQQNYYPEWLTATYMNQEATYVQLTNNPEARQRTAMFGLTFMPHLIRAADDPSIWALQEQDPNLFVPSRDDMSTNRQLTWHKLYRTLLLLASGIQMAGPNLTPETFAEGLHRTVFPNPETPQQAGKVGFLGGSYSMTTDAAEYWWSNNSLPPYALDPSGTWCYVDGGRRHNGGDWTGEPAFFQATVCDSGR